MLDAVLAVLGRTHPLALHIPIGSFAALVLFELLAWLRGRPLELHIRLTLCALVFVSATISVISGLLLAGEPGYSGDTLTQHKISGIAFGGVCLMMLGAAVKRHHRAYFSCVAAACGLMTIAGHLGANMTHGDDFLTAPIEEYFAPRAQRPSRTAPVPSPNASTAPQVTRFDQLIRPILQQTCVSCHGESKTKGGLAVHTFESLMHGGDTGPSIIAGDPDNSELIIRMRLPIDDEDRMPPAKKPQPSEAQIRLLEAWIRAGATRDGTFDVPGNPTDAADAPAAAGASEPAAAPPSPVRASNEVTVPDPAVSQAVAALRGRLVHVETFDPATALLSVDLSPAAGLVPTPELTSLLAPLAGSIGQLTISRLAVDDGLFAGIGRMTSLRVLTASNTGVTQAQLALLVSLKNLERLTLTQSRLTDDAASVLMQFQGLRKLHAWNSGMSTLALAPLRDRGVVVDLGEPAAVQPLETEGDFKLSSDAPPVGAAGGQGEGISRPTNTTCPISGAAVNGDIVVVYKGKATAVCCEKCAAKVLAESIAGP